MYFNFDIMEIGRTCFKWLSSYIIAHACGITVLIGLIVLFTDIRRKPVALRIGQIYASRSTGLQKGSNNQGVDEINKAKSPQWTGFNLTPFITSIW